MEGRILKFFEKQLKVQFLPAPSNTAEKTNFIFPYIYVHEIVTKSIVLREKCRCNHFVIDYFEASVIWGIILCIVIDISHVPL